MYIKSSYTSQNREKKTCNLRRVPQFMLKKGKHALYMSDPAPHYCRQCHILHCFFSFFFLFFLGLRISIQYEGMEWKHSTNYWVLTKLVRSSDHKQSLFEERTFNVIPYENYDPTRY